MAPLVVGGAGFSYQLHSDPESLPVRGIILRAFELGLRTIDTSPYYDPSEQLMGAALSHPEITTKYRRDDYSLMTKVGRIGTNHFDYSPGWIRKSVARSIQRFQTSYLDVVFCHDIEFVSVDEAVTAIGTLFDISKTGAIKRVGISGYDIDALALIATLARAEYGRPVDVIQNWAQLTLQNTQLEQRGFKAFREAGVKAVCSSSPLAVGLLRSGGIPVGRTGNWHPAPLGLRVAAQEAAEWVEENGESLSSLAMRFAVSKAIQNSRQDFSVTTITGISTVSDLEKNVDAAKRVLKPSPATKDGRSTDLSILDDAAVARDDPFFDRIRTILGPWVDYDFSGQAKEKEEKAVAKEIAAIRKQPIVTAIELVKPEVQSDI